MPVVINQFEVVPAPEPGQSQANPPGAAAQGGQSAPPPARLSPHDLERLLRWQAQRQARIRAH